MSQEREIDFIARSGSENRRAAVTFFLPGEVHPRSVTESHPFFGEIMNAIERDDVKQVAALIDPVHGLSMILSDTVTVKDGVMYYNGDQVSNKLTRAIMRMVTRGEQYNKFVRLMENLMDNPEARAVNELYGFMVDNNLPLTADGCVLGYKAVGRDGWSFHSDSNGQRVHYALGKEVSMPREAVNPDPHQTCSAGLHVCTARYLMDTNFGRGGQYFLVKVHPRDFVCIPVDYQNSKSRVCRMRVVAELDVGSGGELGDFDERIRKNLDAFGEQVRFMDGVQMREFLGMGRGGSAMRKYDHLVGRGERVAYVRGGRPVIGYVAGYVDADESYHEGFARQRDEIEQVLVDTRAFEGDGGDAEISEVNVMEPERLVSLKTRYLVAREEAHFWEDSPCEDCPCDEDEAADCEEVGNRYCDVTLDVVDAGALTRC